MSFPRAMQSAVLVLLSTLPVCGQPPAAEDLKAESAQFRSLMRGAQRLSLRLTEFSVEVPTPTWKMEMVSSVAIDSSGLIYLLQRGSNADPVIVVNREGRVIRSWGKGHYRIPHSIRVDRNGNIWTVDAGSSKVLKFSPTGQQLLEIDVGGLPAEPKSEFCGATDIAFGPHDRVFISDGYANARIIEYRGDGKRRREWGSAGDKPGQLRIPHGIAIDSEAVLYVADRENGRIQRFDLDGHYLGEWRHLGKTFSLKVIPAGDLWLGTQPRDVANGTEPWLAKIDRHTGKLLGVIESQGHHSIDLNADGEPLTGARPNKVLWFRSAIP